MVDDEKHYPMLGAAYYPEDWDESEQDHDIEYMVKCGIKVVRIAEFAWSCMEPKPNKFEFDWLHKVVDKLADAGISVIMGTPSPTPPIWLEEKDPSMLQLSADGRRLTHGGRRHCCSNNKTYRKYSARIAEKLAKEFKDDKNIIGWQIDNEIFVFTGKGCFCDECVKGFHKYLQNKYGTIENLNKRWNLNIFSQKYSKFSQVPTIKIGWQNPHLYLEWQEFQAKSHIDFVHMQADILRKYGHKNIGTDMMPFFDVDHDQMNEKLDVVQFNHYEDTGTLWRANLWMDYLRNIKNRPFIITETQSCWNGGVATPGCLTPEGFCKANSWLPIVHGGEANMYWLWRQHWAGHELMHGSVLYASGRPMHIFGEITELSKEYQKASKFLNNTKVITDTAYHVSSRNHIIMENQTVSWHEPQCYPKRTWLMYLPLIEMGIRPDVLGVKKTFDRYKLLITPLLMTLQLGDLQERIIEWVKQGGTWIAGPLTDIRNDIGAHFTDKETGILEEITGAKLGQQFPDAAHKVKCSWNDGSEFGANQWVELFETPEDVNVLASVTGDYYSEYKNKAVVFEKKLGKGTIIVLGTIPNENDLQKIYKRAIDLSGAECYNIEGKVTVSHRLGENEEGYCLVECGGEPASFDFEGKAIDLLTEKVYENHIDIGSYQTVILKLLK